MDLPFSAVQFFEVFARYHAAVWPMPVLLNAVALLVVFSSWRGSPATGRAVLIVLAALWAWTAVAYYFMFFSALTAAAWWFGAAFLVGSASFLGAALRKAVVRFELRNTLGGLAGAALIAYALLFYPLIGHLSGHRFPAVPTFGLPCPTPIFTIGVLLLARTPLPGFVFVVPVLWSALGTVAALRLGVPQDLGLVAAALAAIVGWAAKPRAGLSRSAPPQRRVAT
jgi:Family of unknown function (DUF6064)